MKKQPGKLPIALVSVCSKVSASAAIVWRALIGEATAAYQPERHYMRGPGPKWRAKNGQPAGQS